MQLAFGWYNIIELLFCLVALWMGIRDLQGKALSRDDKNKK